MAEYDKTKMNAFVQTLYDQKMQEGKHGHYETMFHVVHAAIAHYIKEQADSVDAAFKELNKRQQYQDFCDNNCTWADHHPDCIGSKT